MIMNEYLLILIGLLMLILGVLIGVAFLTLLERKVLGYIQIRKGPNKLVIMGIYNLLVMLLSYLLKNKLILYFPIILLIIFPIFSFFLSLLIWMVIPYYFNMISFNLGFLFFCLMSMGVYTVMIAGWSSNSNYLLLGGLCDELKLFFTK